MASAPTV